MRAMLRLTWRCSGFEIALFSLVCVGLSAVMLVLAGLLGQEAPSMECAASGPIGNCSQARSFFDLAATANQLIVLSALLPLLVGGVLGSQLFSRDVERGTLQLPWSMSPSRRRWFFERLLITGAVVVVLLAFVAVATSVLEGAIHPDVSPWRTFLDAGFRGPSVVARGVAAFAVASVIGLVLGRSFPALLTGVALAAVVAVASIPLALAAQSSEIVSPMGRPEVAYAIVRDDLYQNRAGDLLTLNEATSSVPPGTEDPFAWIDANFTEVAVGVPASRYTAVETLACGLLVAFAAASIALGMLGLRRRPY